MNKNILKVLIPIGQFIAGCLILVTVYTLLVMLAEFVTRYTLWVWNW